MTITNNELGRRTAIFLLVLAFISVSLQAEAQARSNQARNAGRIMHGDDATWSQGPWAVSIRRLRDPNDGDSWMHFCGGSLVSPHVYEISGEKSVLWRHDDTRPRWVVTAAH